MNWAALKSHRPRSWRRTENPNTLPAALILAPLLGVSARYLCQYQAYSCANAARKSCRMLHGFGQRSNCTSATLRRKCQRYRLTSAVDPSGPFMRKLNELSVSRAKSPSLTSQSRGTCILPLIARWSTKGNTGYNPRLDVFGRLEHGSSPTRSTRFTSILGDEKQIARFVRRGPTLAVVSSAINIANQPSPTIATLCRFG